MTVPFWFFVFSYVAMSVMAGLNIAAYKASLKTREFILALVLVVCLMGVATGIMLASPT